MKWILKFLFSHSEKLMASHPREPLFSIVVFVPWFHLLLVNQAQLSYFWAFDLYPAQSCASARFIAAVPVPSLRIYFPYFLSLTSLTVWVTYELSEDQYLCNTCTQPIELALPLTQCASLMPARGPLGPLRGAPLVASPPGFCRSLGAQMLCFISCSLYCKSQLYFCVFQIEMCIWYLSMFF